MRRIFALSLLLLPSVPLACRGSVDRFYDDDVDATAPGDAASVDSTTGEDGESTSDGGTNTDAANADAPNEANTDAPLDSDVDAETPDVDAGDGGVGDGSASDAPNDAVNDVKSDVVIDAAPDANDAGCGATNTAQNCGACGQTCDPGGATSTIAACATNTCVYTCKPNRQDCNSAAPNTNGCECEGTGCCAGGCQNVHSNGLGSSYYDCVALGTYNQTQAMKACNAHVAAVAADGGNAGTCGAFLCAGNSGSVVCSNSGTGACNCWKYDPGNSGYNGRVSVACGCPASTSPTWN